MSIQTSAGTILSISAATPATFNSAGYTALTYTRIGEVTDVGQIGRKYNTIKHNPIDTRGTRKFKGSFDEGTQTVKLALDSKDAGQILCQSAVNSDADYSFSVVQGNGDKYYFQGKVMEFMVGFNTVDTVTAATLTFELTTTAAGVGIITVPAA